MALLNIFASDDTVFRNYIKNISCNGYTAFRSSDIPLLREICFPRLQQPLADGLVEYNDRELRVTSKGSSFVRNICSAFDLHLLRHTASFPVLILS